MGEKEEWAGDEDGERVHEQDDTEKEAGGGVMSADADTDADAGADKDNNNHNNNHNKANDDFENGEDGKKEAELADIDAQLQELQARRAAILAGASNHKEEL